MPRVRFAVACVVLACSATLHAAEPPAQPDTRPPPAAPDERTEVPGSSNKTDPAAPATGNSTAVPLPAQREHSATDDVFRPSEEISEDLAVSYPADI